MSLLDPERRARIVAALVQGESTRSASRAARASEGAVLELLGDLGAACRAYHDENVRRLPCTRIRCDALESLHDAGGSALPGWPRDDLAARSRWTWTALCTDTKLFVAFHVGTRDATCAHDFISDLARRLTSRMQLTTDGRNAYLSAVEDASDDESDHALLMDLYGPERAGKARRTPAKRRGALGGVVVASRDMAQVSASNRERASPSLEHLIALHVMHYNFVNAHPRLRVTPAMAAGLAARPWSVDDLLALLPEPARATRGSQRPAEPLKDTGVAGESTGMLPAETSAFFARSAELEDLRRRFEAGARLVTIGGPPGVGKTRLARRYGLLDAGAAGSATMVRFCEVSNAREPVRLVAQIAHTLEFQLTSSRTLDAAVEQVGHALASRGGMLLILDNLDALAGEAAPILVRLLSFAPALRLLVSSREPVHLDGEERLVLGALDADDAIALFEDRVRCAGVTLEASDRPIVRELVRRLDGLPLALELAAARAKVLPPPKLLERLSARLDLLVATRRDAPARHAGLRAAIDSSWGLLTPAERDMLVDLSVFRGGCSLEAAEAVVTLREPSVLDRLESLVDKSLVMTARLAADGGARFFLLDTLREYAEEKLDGLRREELKRRHAEWCVRMAEPLAEATRGTSALEALARLSLESDNLMAALRNMSGRSPDLSARAALALDVLLAVRAPFPLRDALLSEALETAGTDTPARGRLLCARADARCWAGRTDTARSDLFEAQQLALTGTKLEADVELGLAYLAYRDHRYDDVERHCDKATRVYRALGDRVGAARAMRPVCAARFMEGRYGEALDRARTLLAEARAIGDLHLQAFTLQEIGNALVEVGRADDAAASLEESHAISRRLEDRAGEIVTQSNVGNLHLDAGRLTEARAAFERTGVLARAHGSVLYEGAAELNLGLVALDSGAVEEARAHLLRATVRLDGRGYAATESTARALLAAADACMDRCADAESGFAAARAGFEALGEPHHSIVAHVLEGLLDLARAREADRAGDIAGAERWRRRARGRREIPPDTPSSVDLRVACRVLERALPHAGATAVAEAPSTVVRVAVDGRWFQLPGGPRVDLSRRPSLRCLLRTLTEHRLRAPRQPLSASDLIAQTWPGERLISRSGPTRLHTALARLRRLGLRELLLTRHDGYLLDPHAAIEWAGTAPADRTSEGE